MGCLGVGSERLTLRFVLRSRQQNYQLADEASGSIIPIFRAKSITSSAITFQ